MFRKFSYLFLSILLIAACSKIQVLSKKKNERKQLFSISPVFQPLNLTMHPGEVRIVSIPIDEIAGETKLECSGEEVRWMHENKELKFILAETYFSKLLSYQCYLSTDLNEKIEDKFLVINVKIKEKDFPKEKLHVDQKRVFLSKKDQERVANEQLHLNEVYKSTHNKLYFDSNFEYPIGTKITSYYGTKRVFNNKKETQHLGVDFRARVGSKVMASNTGKVVLADNLFFTGNTIILDHGLGLFTVYGHLKESFLSVGDMVKKGDIVGLSGRSGRVTGPHLHWGTKANGNWVDGLYLIKAGNDDSKYANFE